MTPIPVVITFPPMPPRVATTLTLDATISEGHRREADVTSHPVERGSDVTDNIRPKPRQLTLSGIISTAPTTWPGRATILNPDDLGVGQLASSNGPDVGRALAAYRLLEDAFTGGYLLTVQTGLDRYQNLVIKSVEFPKGPGTGRDLNFKLDLEEVLFAVSQTTQVPSSAIASKKVAQQAASRRARGMQPTRKPSQAEAARKQAVAKAAAGKTAAKAAAMKASPPSSWLAQLL
ncbi:MAG: hypothetical protein KGR26_03145 [Cyanobacteria bacterium REEB65]|nr:hypothetical protein [Cyanobacteria bacterium REEB65]